MPLSPLGTYPMYLYGYMPAYLVHTYNDVTCLCYMVPTILHTSYVPNMALLHTPLGI